VNTHTLPPVAITALGRLITVIDVRPARPCGLPALMVILSLAVDGESPYTRPRPSPARTSPAPWAIDTAASRRRAVRVVKRLRTVPVASTPTATAFILPCPFSLPCPASHTYEPTCTPTEAVSPDSDLASGRLVVPVAELIGWMSVHTAHTLPNADTTSAGDQMFES